MWLHVTVEHASLAAAPPLLASQLVMAKLWPVGPVAQDSERLLAPTDRIGGWVSVMLNDEVTTLTLLHESRAVKPTVSTPLQVAGGAV